MPTDDRLLTVLRAFNVIGPCTILQLHRATGISRAAVYRVINCLCRAGYAQQIPGDSRFRLTPEILALSAGYHEDNWILDAGIPFVEALQREVSWPTSIATPDGNRMVVRYTTRYRSPFVFDTSLVGIRLPLLQTALGLAYLAFCPKATRLSMLQNMRSSSDPQDRIAIRQMQVDALLQQTVARGYAIREGGIVADTGSIAVPILTHGAAVASVCITYAASVITQKDIATELLPELRHVTSSIPLSRPKPPERRRARSGYVQSQAPRNGEDRVERSAPPRERP
jgi:IclR family mhp operon transcriptional activator